MNVDQQENEAINQHASNEGNKKPEQSEPNAEAILVDLSIIQETVNRNDPNTDSKQCLIMT